MRALILLFLLGIAAVLNRCTDSTSAAPGSSDHGNGRICGTLVKPDGDPARSANVVLLPDECNYAVDSATVWRHTAQTDTLGRFSIDSIPRGSYCLSATHSWSNSALVEKGIYIQNDTTELPVLPLDKPGDMVINVDSMGILPGTILYFPGLPKIHTVDSASFQWINGIPSGIVSLEGYDPISKNSIDLGVEFDTIEIYPGYSLNISVRLSPPVIIIDSGTVRHELDGIADSTYRFCAVEPGSYPQDLRFRYRFSWGNDAESPWSADPFAEYAWNKPGVYFVQTQMKVETTFLAWSDPITIIVREKSHNE